MAQASQPKDSTKQQETASNNDQQLIIEEKISKVNGDIAIKRYQRGKLLGKGGFAKCYEIQNLENKAMFAAKIIPKSSLTKNRARQKLISEIKIHKALHHSNVVQFEHVFEDHENVYILLEICHNQTLNELLKRRKRLTELEVQSYVLQILLSLKYLHANRVIHRDMKLGNLFLSEKMELKVGDFGLATKLEFDGEKKRTICGTPNYIAPEILDGKSGHSYEVDVWSLGVIIYTLLIGKPPFETPDVKATYKKIRMNSYSFPEHVPISDNARGLITRILNLDPARRPTLEEMEQHPFLNPGIQVPKLLPLSTLACPPSASYLKQFQPTGNQMIVNKQPQRIETTQPAFSRDPMANSNANMNSQNLNKINSMGSQEKFPNKWSQTQTNFGNQDKNPRPATSQKDFIKPVSTLPGNLQNSQNMNNMMQTTGNLNQKNGKPGSTMIKSEVWVKKWVDYSSKYGLGYLLSNGSTGVFFNDSTKIVLHPKGTYFEYIERRMADKQDVLSQHTFADYPKELQKKVTLLQHFKNYLEGGDNKSQMDQQFENDEVNKNQPLVYLKKWMKTRHAIMFRLSNKIVQVNFTDKTEVILSSEHKMLTYVNKKGERSNYPLATALESTNTEMTKRLKYTKEILAHMLNNNPQSDKNQMQQNMPNPEINLDQQK